MLPWVADNVDDDSQSTWPKSQRCDLTLTVAMNGEMRLFPGTRGCWTLEMVVVTWTKTVLSLACKLNKIVRGILVIIETYWQDQSLPMRIFGDLKLPRVELETTVTMKTSSGLLCGQVSWYGGFLVNQAERGERCRDLLLAKKGGFG